MKPVSPFAQLVDQVAAYIMIDPAVATGMTTYGDQRWPSSR
jgi:hypothetical protein